MPEGIYKTGFGRVETREFVDKYQAAPSGRYLLGKQLAQSHKGIHPVGVLPSFISIQLHCSMKSGHLFGLAAFQHARHVKVKLSIEALTDKKSLSHTSSAIESHKLGFARMVVSIQQVKFLLSTDDIDCCHIARFRLKLCF